MILSNRLQEVVNLIPKSNVVADIGCDHAHVAIYLVERKIANRVIACDVNEGPLEMAKNNVSQAGLKSQVELRLSDGLKALKSNEADAVVVAGMGGKLMRRIIEEGFDRISENTSLILQPQSDVPEFRLFLLEKGFCIETESMIFEDGKYYPMMRARMKAPGEQDVIYDELELEYGKHLLDDKNAVLYDFVNRECKQLKAILSELKKQGVSQRSSERIDEISQKIALNNKALERFI